MGYMLLCLEMPGYGLPASLLRTVRDTDCPILCLELPWIWTTCFSAYRTAPDTDYLCLCLELPGIVQDMDYWLRYLGIFMILTTNFLV